VRSLFVALGLGLLGIVLVPCGQIYAQGQTQANLTGEVADQSKAAIPGVTITLLNVATGQTRGWGAKLSAENPSTTTIGAPHLGQRQRSGESRSDDTFCSAGGLLCHAQQLKTKRQEGGAFPVGQETEVANPHEAFGKQVQQEAAQELIER